MFYLNGGGLFTTQGRWWDEQVESLVGELGASVYNPGRDSKGQSAETVSGRELRKRVFEADRGGVDVSQGVIMLGEGAAGEVSSGTAWETGYAYARRKPILSMRTDIRGALNPLLKECLLDRRVCSDLADLRDHVKRALERLRGSEGAKTSYDRPARPRGIGKLFLSAPYFTAAEETFAKGLEKGLAELGFDVLFFQGARDLRGSPPSSSSRHLAALFEEKVRSLDDSDAVVALLDGADCNSEVSWDCGYGYSKYKPVFGMRTDFRSLGDLGGRVNLMLEQSIVDSKLCGSLDEVRRLADAGLDDTG